MSWREGYVTDVAYTRGVYLEAAPANLSVCALMGGTAAPDPRRPFRYLELGCGAGVGICLFAAANPHAEFVGVDFNPSHVASARRLIAAAGLDNARVEDASFADLADGTGVARGLGRFDYAVAHGVWTWVSRGVQAELVRALDRSVQPGGLVYMGYNNMAGWAPVLPLQRLLIEHAQRTPGDSVTKIRAALTFALGLREAQPRALDLERLERVLERVGGDPAHAPSSILSYLAHEYLNEHWRPVFASELEADLSEAKLSYVGSADPFGALPQVTLTDAQAKAAAAYADPAGSRRLADLLAPAAFRQDLFCRGPTPLSPQAREAELRAVRLRLVAPPELIELRLKVPSGELELDAAAYRPLLHRLGRGPATVGELLRAVADAGGRMGALELLAVTLGSGWASPEGALAEDEADLAERRERVRRYNLAMIDSMRDQPGTRMALASPVLAGGVGAAPVHVAALLHTLGLHQPTEAEMEAVTKVEGECGALWRALEIV